MFEVHIRNGGAFWSENLKFENCSQIIYILDGQVVNYFLIYFYHWNRKYQQKSTWVEVEAVIQNSTWVKVESKKFLLK